MEQHLSTIECRHRYSALWENDGDVPTHLFQIWLDPVLRGGTPRWGSKPFPKADRPGAFIVLASGRGAEGALPVRLADSELLRVTTMA